MVYISIKNSNGFFLVAYNLERKKTEKKYILIKLKCKVIVIQSVINYVNFVVTY